MKGELFDYFWIENAHSLCDLIAKLQNTIPADNVDGLTLVVSMNEACTEWRYQLEKDLSGIAGRSLVSIRGEQPSNWHWRVGTIYQDSDPRSVAKDIISKFEPGLDWSDNKQEEPTNEA